MDDKLILKNRLKEARAELKISQTQLAEMVGVSRNTISSIETGQFNPTAKLALILCIALDKKFEDLFWSLSLSAADQSASSFSLMPTAASTTFTNSSVVTPLSLIYHKLIPIKH